VHGADVDVTIVGRSVFGQLRAGDTFPGQVVHDLAGAIVFCYADGNEAAWIALAVRQAISGQDRRSLSAARARIARQAAHPSLLKDITMRYKVVVSRVQTAERHVRAISEEEAIRKV
jgi:hypothetical protein